MCVYMNTIWPIQPQETDSLSDVYKLLFIVEETAEAAGELAFLKQ